MREEEAAKATAPLRLRRLAGGLVLAAVIAASSAASALGAFPYTRSDGSPTDYKDFFLTTETPSDLTGKLEWMYAATPEPGLPGAVPGPPLDPFGVEHGGIRGSRLADAADAPATAWETTTGRPDVQIAVLDSGIKWDDVGAMNNLRFKTWLNRGELPEPNRLRGTSLTGGGCPGHGGSPGVYDVNGDGVFNLADYACDDRVSINPPNNVNPGQFEPQDILIAFTDGDDDDGNGFNDDMVGWDFLDNDNDPYDDVQYGHGTGEAQDSTAEANNGGELGACPNCMSMHMRVGDSFIADSNRFAGAVLYGTDNGALVIQEALGAINNTRLAREAVDYAYRHGTVTIASAADEAAQHNNWPSSLPHVILVNSVTKYTDPDEPFTPFPRSYLQFTGCTNFNSKVTVAIPSVSCSSDATGRGSGMAGLIYSAALNAVERGKLAPHPRCTRTFDGPDAGTALDPCPISPNEVRQLMATGTVGGVKQVDDVDFLPTEPSCGLVALAGCTDPYNPAVIAQLALARPVVSPLATTRSYPARGGHDQFYGYGRADISKAVGALVRGPLGDPAVKSLVPPEVEILSPEWFDQVDPAQPTFQIRGEISARPGSGACSYRVLVAPGHYPNNDHAPAGDFHEVGSGSCSTPVDGVLATVATDQLESRFPAGTSFDGRQPTPTPGIDNGRPFAAPNGFTVKVVASTSQSGTDLTGADHRTMWLHRDRDALPGFPRKLTSESTIAADGESSPAFADLDGDNRNELIVATSDGFVHAYRPNGSELPDWPVRGERPGIVHTGGRAYTSGEVSDELGGPFLASVAVGDADRDGVPEVYAADIEGKLYGWNPQGDSIFSEQANPAYSGKPLQAFVNVRKGKTTRTQGGFIGSPVLADIDGDDGGRLEIVAANMDRHVYAWNANGSEVPGYPVLVVDPNKVASIDPQTHKVVYKGDAAAEMQGAIIDTPAIADLDADANDDGADELPEIVIGTNEEYSADEGSEGPLNVALPNSVLASVLAPAGILSLGNSRLFALDAEGDRDGNPDPANAIVSGWPAKIGLANTELLPIVGEGITGSPVIGPANCPEGGSGPKVGVIPGAGFGYILNPDATSCYGRQDGRDIALQSDFGLSALKYDSPMLAAVGNPAFGAVGTGTSTPQFLSPAAGAIRALDLAVNEYQGGQDFAMAWDPGSGQPLPGFPGLANDLSFLTGPSIADIDGTPGEEVVSGTSAFDLNAYNALGLQLGNWPKLTSDWTIANPLIGSFGTLDTAGSARKVVVNLTRSGYLNAYETDAPACSPSSWPRFHHDNANSGWYDRDAILPGAPIGFALNAGNLELDAPGDDLLCGTAEAYQLVTSNQPINGSNFSQATPLGGAPAPAAPGEHQSFALPAGAQRYVAIRAVDDQGNVGRTESVDRGADPGPGPGPGPGSGPAPGASGGTGGALTQPGTGQRRPRRCKKGRRLKTITVKKGKRKGKRFRKCVKKKRRKRRK